MRILVIEDEADLLASLAKALREEACAVDAAADGEEGLYNAENTAYDAIVLAIGELSINTATRQVTLSNTPVALTAREYCLLEFLALHRGETVTRTVLYEHLFDEDDDTLSNLLDVHVSNLRKKLGHELIATRRGLGYCIE